MATFKKTGPFSFTAEREEKFKTYIKERENIIQKLVGEDSEVREKGKVIYP